MAVAAVEHGLHKEGAALGSRQRRHHRGLGVGGEARVRGGADGGHALQGDLPVPLQLHVFHPALHPAPGLVEHGQHRGQMPPVHPPQAHPPPGGRRRRQQGGRHDPVSHDGVLPAGQGAAPLHCDGGAARPPHVRPQQVQEALEIPDLRLPGGVGDGGGAVRSHGAQHGVLRGPHAGHGQLDLAPPGPTEAVDAPVLRHLTAQGADGGQVQVDGPGAKLTAAGIGEVGLPRPGQQGAEEDDGRAHGPHLFLGNGTARRPGGVHRDNVPLLLHPAAQAAQNAQGGVHVGEPGAVVERHRAPGQQAGG